MQKIILYLISVLSLSLCAAMPPAEQFAFSSIFSSNMVLQRERPVLLTGTGTPGAQVSLRLGRFRRTVPVDSSGRWSAEFPAMKAGGPYAIILSGAPRSRKVILSNILIGELWFCSGQSNMTMPVYSRDPYWRTENAGEERENARHPRIRLFQAPRVLSPLQPCTDLPKGSWQACTPDTAGSFSALAYFFGRELHRRLNVPIGLIHASCGGSPIEAWLPGTVFQEHPRDYAPELKKLGYLESLQKKIRSEQNQEARQNKWFRDFYSRDPQASQNARVWKNFQYRDKDWEEIKLPWIFPQKYCGVIWFRNSFILPPEFTDAPLEIQLDGLSGRDETFFNGRLLGSAPMKPQTSSAGGKQIYRIPAGTALRGKNVLAVRISKFADRQDCRWAADDIIIRKLDNGKIFTLPASWKNKMEFLIPADKLPEIPIIPQDEYDRQNTHGNPASLYNGMVAPWTGLPIRGIIWYQGCANAGQKQYYRRHRDLINAWRNSWKQPDMPFLLVQLSAFEQHRPDHRLADDFWKTVPPKDDVPWALTREIQTEMTRLPNVGMAVSIDRGDHSDIHPRDKQTPGFRLAARAAAMVYGQKQPGRGPVYDGMRIENDKIRIYFKNAEPRLKTSDGRMPGCVAIAGKDGKFHWARTQIIGSTLLVYSPEVPRPTAVRYGWVSYRGDLNLCNEDGFPAEPFRTDKPDYPDTGN